MNTVILTRTYKEPDFSEKEILRYAGCKNADEGTKKLVADCTEEARKNLIYKVCYGVFNLEIEDKNCDFGVFSVDSERLAENLSGCNQAVIFAATVGVGIDRLISKYTRISPSRALFFQAIGAERIEALCGVFCSDIQKEYSTIPKPRFSPGYGDLPLTVQNSIFSVLSPSTHIGLTLNSSLLMSPTKSVTAIIGLSKQ